LSARSALPSRLVLAAAILLVLLGVVLYVTRTTTRPVDVAGGNAGPAFDKGRITDSSAERALFSPDGAQLAVITSGGVGIATAGAVHLITPDGSAVDDAAWMPDARSLLVIEGGAQVDRITVLDLNGAVRGVAHLDAPIEHAGDGVAVDSRGVHAAVVTETRDAIGGVRHHDLALIDLTTGHVTALTRTADVDEEWPVFVDDNTVAFARTAAGHTTVATIDTGGGGLRRVSPPGETARPVARLRGGQLVYSSSVGDGAISVWALSGGGADRVRLGRLPRRAEVWSVDPAGDRAVASVALTRPDGERVSPLEAVTMRPPPAG
jgi:hypothetical protein